MSLSEDQRERYKSQLSLPGMSEARQEKLLSSSIVLLGLDPCGTNCAVNLAQAGIGKIILVDQDLVVESDLSKHSVFTSEDINYPKVDILKRKLTTLNPDIQVRNCFFKFDTHNADHLLGEGELVVEGLESWQDKLVASDSCMQRKKALIHSGLLSFSFHVFSMIPGRSACLRCVFARLGLEDFPPDGFKQSVLGAIASLAGAFQAAEAIKLITQIGTISGNHLLRFDVLRSEFDDMTELIGRSDCPDCGRWG
ncbi:MAG: ThiF family adenylyltransferase [Candidatus Obscuribacterales bacterium]|nr:ThiF family adenylyltransferase [Candidatus Obscuribacterales bacterium]